MRALLWLGCLAMTTGAVLVGQAQKASSPDDAARAAIIKLWGSLSDEQKCFASVESGRTLRSG